MNGLPSMVFALVALTLLAANSFGLPAPVAFPGLASSSAASPKAPAALGAPGAPKGDPKAADTKDLEGAETFGYGYGVPLAYSYYGYPSGYRLAQPFRQYRYGLPYYSSYWDDWESYYYWL